jgi:putative nucleotidyltransferase with HDIG domain
MKKKLLKLIPEFELIVNKDLREKTINVWIEAVKMGGWTINDLVNIPFTLLIPDTKVNIIEHTRSITNICSEVEKIFRKIYGNKMVKINRDILISGALLHDVGKILEFTKKDNKYIKSKMGKLLRHPFSGAGLAFKLGLPDEVVHIIAVHAKEGDLGKRTPEAIILHHVDFINFEPLKDSIQL